MAERKWRRQLLHGRERTCSGAATDNGTQPAPTPRSPVLEAWLSGGDKEQVSRVCNSVVALSGAGTTTSSATQGQQGQPDGGDAQKLLVMRRLQEVRSRLECWQSDGFATLVI